MAAKASDPRQLPEGITTEILRGYFSVGQTWYRKAFDRMRLLDAADKGRLWEALRAKFPSYQILPDTNNVSWVKDNILASIYTVKKAAHLLPTSEDTASAVFAVNSWLDHYWDTRNIGYYQFLAGERAALTNIGITQVGWNPGTKDPENIGANGGPVLKNIDPMQFVRSPFADSLQNSGWCYTWAPYHSSVFQSDPRYKAGFETYLLEKRQGSGSAMSLPEKYGDGPNATQSQSAEGNYLLVVFYVKDGEKIHEIHTIAGEYVLFVKQNIKPAMFPFAILYCNEPAGDLVGTSTPAKIFSNNVAINLMDSLMLTAEYKNQNPPKFISSTSGLNIGSFVEHGHEADKTFVVSGDASRAVHYHQFPAPSVNTPGIVSKLGADIQQVSGVDGKYTGRDTGSILTTGGMEAMLDQVTLIDAPKIMFYEEYTRQLTQLILSNMLEFSPKRKYVILNPGTEEVKSIEIDFPKLPKDILSAFAISISSDLPKNKQRIANMANMLMEKQMQYTASGMKVELITPEEWLEMQDLPFKERMQERMGIQRSANYLEQVATILTTFSELTKMGAPPEEAMQMTAQMMEQSQRPGGQPPEMPMVAPEAPAIPPDLGQPMAGNTPTI